MAYDAYVITCAPTGLQYVGITSTGIAQRWGVHVAHANRGCKWRLHRAIRKYGPNQFTVDHVACAISAEALYDIERALILQYGTRSPGGYNLTLGGQGSFGAKRSLATRRRMAAAQTGKKLSPEHREKLRLAKLGKKQSPHQVFAMAAAKRGTKVSAEGRRNMALGQVKRWQRFYSAVAASLAVFLALTLFPSQSTAAQFPTAYDKEIKAAAERWWPGEPWRLWKAQLYQESRLDPLARSPVGAMGIAQFMPATWEDVTKAMGWELIDRRLAGPAIEGGAYYMATLRRQWASRDTMHQFAQASYNAGAGNIRRAWRLCGKPGSWELTTDCLPEITGKHAKETIGYVRLIDKWHKRMELE